MGEDKLIMKNVPVMYGGSDAADISKYMMDKMMMLAEDIGALQRVAPPETLQRSE